MIIITTAYELSSVVGKCKSCKRYKFVTPGFELCYGCIDVKTGKIKMTEQKRRSKALERIQKQHEMIIEWNKHAPW